MTENQKCWRLHASGLDSGLYISFFYKTHYRLTANHFFLHILYSTAFYSSLSLVYETPSIMSRKLEKEGSLDGKLTASEKMRARLNAISKQHEDVDLRKKQVEDETRRMKLRRTSSTSQGESTKSLGDTSARDEDGAPDQSFNSPALSTSSGRKTYKGQAPTYPGNDDFSRSRSDSNSSMGVLNPSGLTTIKSNSELGAGQIGQEKAVRVSDWILKDPNSEENLQSQPPVVKTTEVYETVRTLGRGAFGDVNLVKSTDDNRLYADKTIYTQEERYYIETLREVKFLRQYGAHPFIMEIFDCYVIAQPKVLHIIMPYCEAGDIGKIIVKHKKNKTSLPEPMLLKWTLQIALALQYLHKHGVVHRDLKPENVMLVEGGEIVKLCDFGLALICGEAGDREAAAEAGTPYYTAPEMILGKRCSYNADCWSFGVMIYEMMALTLPFVGNTTTALVKAILTEPPRLMPSDASYSESIRSIAFALLNKSPQERLDTVTLLTNPSMATKLANIPPAFRPKTLEERTRRQFVRQLSGQVEELKSNPLLAAGLAAPSTAESGESLVKFKLGDVDGMAARAAVSALVHLDKDASSEAAAAAPSSGLISKLAHKVERFSHTKQERARRLAGGSAADENNKHASLPTADNGRQQPQQQQETMLRSPTATELEVKIPSPLTSPEHEHDNESGENTERVSVVSQPGTPLRSNSNTIMMSDSIENTLVPAIREEEEGLKVVSPLQGTGDGAAIRGGAKGAALNEALVAGRLQEEEAGQ